MLKRVYLLLLLCLVLIFTACTGEKTDYFAPVSGAFCAELHGTYHGMEIAAVLEVQAPDEAGVREATLRFSEPQTLAGMCVTRAQTGEVSLSVGDICVPTQNHGFDALLDIFPASGEVTEVVLENGLTRVNGTGFSLFFNKEGTPAAAENAAASVTVTRFEKR